MSYKICVIILVSLIILFTRFPTALNFSIKIKLYNFIYYLNHLESKFDLILPTSGLLVGSKVCDKTRFDASYSYKIQ